MNTTIKKILFSTVAIAVAVLFAASYSNNANAQQRSQQSQTSSGWQYAQLLALENDQYKWDEGGNQVPVARSLRALQRELGSNDRETRVNLLNAIGSNGWQLITVEEEKVWTFMRRNTGA